MEPFLEKTTEFIKFHDFFFKQKFGKRKTPLFKSQAELAEVCMSDPSNPMYGKMSVTVRSSISQIFIGERKVSKNVSTALKQAIVTVIKDENLLKTIISELDTLLIQVKDGWKDFIETKAKHKAKMLLSYAEIEEKLKYTYEPGITILTEDIEYLLYVIKGSGDKINLEVLMTLLKQRKEV